MFKIQGIGCYDLNVTFIYLQKMVIYNLSSSNSGTFPVLPALEEKDDKVFGKNTVTFWHNNAYVVNSFVSHFISYNVS